jgi:hypothetical protein
VGGRLEFNRLRSALTDVASITREVQGVRLQADRAMVLTMDYTIGVCRSSVKSIPASRPVASPSKASTVGKELRLTEWLPPPPQLMAGFCLRTKSASELSAHMPVLL